MPLYFRFRRIRFLPALFFGLLAGLWQVVAAPTEQVEQRALQITRLGEDSFLVDFGQVAFSNLLLTAPSDRALVVHFGEAQAGGRVNRQPPGTVRHQAVSIQLIQGRPQTVAPRADKRNTTPPAVLTPEAFGVLLPFRWVEIEGWQGELLPEQVLRKAVFVRGWDDQAASFHCSDERLNRIWELCRYSIKATSFAGVYVDGDRERIPYEADAYLNQLSHYACESSPQMARDTFDYLMQHPTWPSEWAPHMIFMAYADWMQTGDKAWLAARYDALKQKLQLERSGPDGLLTSNPAQMKRDDIVDWPAGERDGYEFSSVNTVVNAFHLRALRFMVELARVLGRSEDVMTYKARLASGSAAFQDKLFDPTRGLYRDGLGSTHASLHANLFPLAFGLAPRKDRAALVSYLKSKGMACSVYAAQYLLEALFDNGAAEAALDLMVAPGDRSWRHMVESGTTITWEAWDQRYKPNQDWNHAWGAAPANLLPRYVLGVQALTPGWGRASIRPQMGSLSRAEGRVPTPRGAIFVAWSRQAHFQMKLQVPEGLKAQLQLPALEGTAEVLVNGTPVRAERMNGSWLLLEEVTGTALIEVR